MIAHQFLWALEVEEVTAPKVKKRYLPKDYIQYEQYLFNYYNANKEGRLNNTKEVKKKKN